jgi:hypothetical protein
MAKWPKVATKVALKVTPAISNLTVDVEGPHYRAFWIARWVFFSVALFVGLFLVLGEMGQKLEHKKADPVSSSAQSSDN